LRDWVRRRQGHNKKIVMLGGPRQVDMHHFAARQTAGRGLRRTEVGGKEKRREKKTDRAQTRGLECTGGKGETETSRERAHTGASERER